MRGPSTGVALGVGAVETLVRTLAEEFPELDRARLRTAIERATARIASSALDTEGYQVVDMHLQRAEATEEANERAQILRELSENLEARKDADRALVVRLSAFAEHASTVDLDPLLRLARLTERWAELPLDAMNGLIDINEDGAVRRLADIAAAWQHVGRGYHAADCYERVLLIEPGHVQANEALELFYRSVQEWPVLVDLLGRRAVHATDDKERAELLREIGLIHERELNDAAGALDAYRESDRLEPDRPDVLEPLARLSMVVGVPEEEALNVLERSGRAIVDPKTRARVLVRAAELAKLENWDRAQSLFEAARKDDPDLAEAVEGFVPLLRDRGQLADAINLLLAGAERPALAANRSRWLTDAGDLCVALGDTDWAKTLYLDARAADPSNHKAGAAVVELCWDSGQLVELAPILDELVRITDDPNKLREYLLQRGKVAQQLGDKTGARSALSRVLDLDPEDKGSRRELADMLYEAQHWDKARGAIEALLADEDLLPPGVAIELHYKLARTTKELGDRDAAAKHVDVALVLQPDHRPSLELRTELGSGDPLTRIQDQLALASSAPPDERAARFAAIGDRYSELGDRLAARDMYREALAHKPGDHLLLTKFLELVTEDGDWSYSLDVVQKLVDTESDPKVRARYRHLAGMIARDELDDHERASALFEKAIDDHAHAFGAADDLESLLTAGTDRNAVVAFYYRRLEQVRGEEGRGGERLRLWDRLGELLLDLDQHDDALVAFEVGLELAPAADQPARRLRLVDLYAGSDTKHDTVSIDHHQALVRADHKRIESYSALRMLYGRIGELDRARACDDAVILLSGTPSSAPVEVSKKGIDSLFEQSATNDPIRLAPRREPPTKPLAQEDWLALSRLDVDGQLSHLFAIVAPPFAVERARMRPPIAMPPKEPDAPQAIKRALDRAVRLLATPRPPVYVEVDQLAPVKMAMRARGGVLTPVLIVGKNADRLDEKELVFRIARQLADLRTDRIARLLCPRAGELAQIIELALQPQLGEAPQPAARWLQTSLHPVELEQARSLGAKLRERAVQPMAAALGVIAATERAADRIAFVITGDLAGCTKILAKDPSNDAGRVADLVWASVTEDVLGVRAKLEDWPAVQSVSR
ncbi:MAG: tetratricopeptide repeat protein [Deltaproteobacteria bacterium]